MFLLLCPNVWMHHHSLTTKSGMIMSMTKKVHFLWVVCQSLPILLRWKRIHPAGLVVSLLLLHLNGSWMRLQESRTCRAKVRGSYCYASRSSEAEEQMPRWLLIVTLVARAFKATLGGNVNRRWLLRIATPNLTLSVSLNAVISFISLVSGA